MRKFIITLMYIMIIALILYFVFNYKTFIVTSGSMEPTIKTGEMVIVKNKGKSSSYMLGDIITYSYNNSFVTHRIIEIDEDKIYTQGDFNNCRDLEAVNNEQIIGKVVFHSYILGVIYTKYKLYIILVLMISICVSLFRKKRIKNE